MDERPILIEENADLIREAMQIRREELKQPMQHFIKQGSIVTFICYKYKVHRILLINYTQLRYVERKVRRLYAPIFFKIMKSQKYFNFYTDEVEFDFMVTKGWNETNYTA